MSSADPCQLYHCMRSVPIQVIQELENATKTLFQWFSDNQVKANPDQCRFLCISNSDVSLTIEKQKM